MFSPAGLSNIHENLEGSSVPLAKNPKSEDKKSRVILNILPKLPSTDSLSNSPGPGSPGKIYFIENSWLYNPQLPSDNMFLIKCWSHVILIK